MAELSPMMKQYLEIKEQNKDCILFFRLGDFYEMFFEDAEIASKELELVLTGRDCGLETRAPMCGVPYHSYEGYLARLVARGYKVAICEQTELPQKGKTLVNREIVRIVTPGTIVEGSMLDEEKNNYLCVLYGENDIIGAVFVDVSTGELDLTQINTAEGLQNLYSTLSRYAPSEIIFNDSLACRKELIAFARDRLNSFTEEMADHEYLSASSKQIILDHFKAESLLDLKLTDYSQKTRALGAALKYLLKTQKTVLDSIYTINVFSSSQYMSIDASTRRNLELCEAMLTKSKKGSLLSVLDKTKTAMGKRLIRKYIEEPLLSVGLIQRRQNSVAELFDDTLLRTNLTHALGGIFDMERILSRIAFGSVTPKELKALSATLLKIPSIKQQLFSVKTELLISICTDLDELSDIVELIDNAITDDPPATLKDGGVIRRGYNEELDRLVSDMSGGKDIIREIEQRERESTGIKNLKVGYNRVFGYYIEISNAYKDMAPDTYIRRQTLTNGERYITEELKELEKRVLGAKERSIALEHEIYEAVRTTVSGQHSRIQKTAAAISQLDVLLSLATVANENDYSCPVITQDGSIDIVEGRHPVVEQMLKSTPFVPNDTRLDLGADRCAVITGPNMAGKSTYMRQVALIVLMAQIGSFVPAKSAKISVCDAIFTRVGASDDLASGQSTFMVEMKEVANILQCATRNSLLIFDEIGRGTSTFDGMSIARAVIEYTVNKKRLGAKALFSTHYHELTKMEEEYEGIKNYNIAAKKRGEDVIFLRKIVRGGTDDSYGIEVARLAGVPTSVISRARQILAELESERIIIEGKSAKQHSELPPQAFTNEELDLIDDIKRIDPETLTPIEAMQELYNIVTKAKNI